VITAKFNPINGDQTVTATYGGDSNYDGSNNNVVVHVTPAPTSVSITSNPSGSVVAGQPVVYTAVVSSAFGTPTGTITFTPGGVAILNAQGQASVTVKFTASGTNTFTAVYNGDGNFATSQNSQQKQVNQADTTTSFTLNPNLSTLVVGQTVTLTATVTTQSPSTGPATGSVLVNPGNIVIPLVNGVASAQVAFFTHGNAVTISVKYQPDVTGYKTSQASRVVKINPAATSLSLTSSPPKPNRGQLVQITATVNVKSPGGGSPDGFVSFGKLGVAQVVNGKATITTSFLHNMKVDAKYVSTSGNYKTSFASITIKG
jgi:hypothetical protein